jgi:hypothetical protein
MTLYERTSDFEAWMKDAESRQEFLSKVVITTSLQGTSYFLEQKEQVLSGKRCNLQVT